MNEYQNRRLDQLVDKLIWHEISLSEFTEYNHLRNLLIEEQQNVSGKTDHHDDLNNHLN